MSYSVVLRIIGGSFEAGYDIQAEIRHDRQIICTESGHLPPNPEIPRLYEETFPAQYAMWGSRSNWGQRTITDGDGIVESIRACVNTARELDQLFQNWMQYAHLADICSKIARKVPHDSKPLFILEAPGNIAIQRLPWHKWEWLDREYPGTEVVLSRNAFPVEISQQQLRILVILGSEENIDLTADRAELENNLESIAELKILEQPDFHDLCDQIRQGCDIIFFAGHSDSNDKSGWIKINQHKTIDINELISELRAALSRGLKMVFMNSCSGLGIASQLAELNVPYIVAMREPIHNNVAVKFIKHCLASLAQGNSLTSAVAASRIKLRRLEDQYICASWMPIIFQSREASDYVPFPQRIEQPQETPPIPQSTPQSPPDDKTMKIPPIVLLAGGLAAALIAFNMWPSGSPEISDSKGNQALSSQNLSPTKAEGNESTEISESIGDRALFPQNSSPTKTEGIRFFANKEYQKAIEQFKISLQSKPNDPETRIYLNNALALQQSKNEKSLLIIPIVSSATNGHSTAAEVLRGAAIAQENINQQKGINGQQILLKIILDNNNDNLARKVAQKLVAEGTKVVVGHVDSNTSVAAAPIYEKAGVVMVSAASSTMELRDLGGNFIFRTVPNSAVMTKSLSDHISKVAKKKKIGVCYDSKLTAGKTFKDAFIADITKNGGSVIPTKCDASDQGFEPRSIQKMVNQGADGLVVYLHLNEDYQLKAAYDIAKAAKNLKLPLFGSASLVASDILKSGQDFEGMRLVTPRHHDSPLAAKFSKEFKQVFHDEPTWRDMMGYDAVTAIAVGLNASDGTSKGLAEKWHDSNFVIPNGSSGPIRFSKIGDRVVTPTITQVQCQTDKCRYAWTPDPKIDPK